MFYFSESDAKTWSRIIKMINLAKQCLGGYLITIVLGNANRNIANRNHNNVELNLILI